MALKNNLKYTEKNVSKFVKAYVDNYGNLKRAVEKVGISKATYYHWRHKYPEFKEMMDSLKEHVESDKKDLFEGLFIDAAVNGNWKAIERGLDSYNLYTIDFDNELKQKVISVIDGIEISN